jgi:DNA-binding transcriptional LysR family regulator
VRSLEDALEVTIFDRSGHRATLTDEGRLLLAEGRKVLAEAARLERMASELRRGWEPRLSIVVDGLLPLSPILRALRRFAGEGAPTRVGLRVEYLGGVRARFDRDEADLMIALDFAGAPTLSARPVPPVEMLLLARPDHPLFGATRRSRVRGKRKPSPRSRSAPPITRDDLAAHVELVVEDSRPGGVPGPGRLSLGSPHLFRLSDFHSKREALLEGVGFGWMPRHLVETDLAKGRLVPLGFEEGDRYVFHPHLASRRDPPPGPAARRVLSLLEEELGER